MRKKVSGCNSQNTSASGRVPAKPLAEIMSAPSACILIFMETPASSGAIVRRRTWFASHQFWLFAVGDGTGQVVLDYVFFVIRSRSVLSPASNLFLRSVPTAMAS